MTTCSVAHLSDSLLRRELVAIAAQDRSITARLLIHMAEFDSRRLYLEDGYPSMYAYCVGELGMSEDMAYKRIRAGRAARRFPAIFSAVADGRLHLSAVVMLAPYLTQETAADLLSVGARQSKSQIEHLLAERFPRPDLPTLIQAVPPPKPGIRSQESQDQLAPGPVTVLREPASQPSAQPPGEPLGIVHIELPVRVQSKVAPVAPQRYALQLTMSQSMHDKLRRAQDLLGHQIPSGDVVQVLERALDSLVRELERRKLGATSRPRKTRRESRNPRHIPASVRRAVRKRDGDQCTFVSQTGHRCEARKMLEFDHAHECARGGEATVGNVRLRCRSHNQFTAEQTFGVEKMATMREETRRLAENKRGPSALGQPRRAKLRIAALARTLRGSAPQPCPR